MKYQRTCILTLAFKRCFLCVYLLVNLRRQLVFVYKYGSEKTDGISITHKRQSTMYLRNITLTRLPEFRQNQQRKVIKRL